VKTAPGVAILLLGRADLRLRTLERAGVRSLGRAGMRSIGCAGVHFPGCAGVRFLFEDAAMSDPNVLFVYSGHRCGRSSVDRTLAHTVPPSGPRVESPSKVVGASSVVPGPIAKGLKQVYASVLYVYSV
jgi:hypothetical protein